MLSPTKKDVVLSYLMNLQKRIVKTVSDIDGTTFIKDKWEKNPGDLLQGKGITQILEGGPIFERAGCGFSHVHGSKLPPSATISRPELIDSGFEAMGISLVFHPSNPYVPTVHMNLRMLTTINTQGSQYSWFGGGMDLTPIYGFSEDAIHFHQCCKKAVDSFGVDKYPLFKKNCDDYFYLKHRNEQRGIGGIFFDDFSELGFDNGFSLIKSVGDAFIDAYFPIVEKRHSMTYTEEQRKFQLYRRGRYVEFNLVWDRGTHFGLQSGGRTESILLSMPPKATWSYQPVHQPNSPESSLYRDFLIPKDWI